MLYGEDKPEYRHDCDSCRFVGNLYGREVNEAQRSYDVWVCPSRSGLGGSLIARYGNDGPEYASWPLSASMVTRYESRVFRAAFGMLCETFKVTLQIEPRQ